MIKNFDFVDLTIGRCYFKPLNNGTLKKAYIVGTIAGNVLNNASFLHYLERKLLKLSTRKIRRLTVQDGLKVTSKIKEILIRHGIWSEEVTEEKKPNKKEKTEFTPEEEEFFNEAKAAGVARIQAKAAKR